MESQKPKTVWVGRDLKIHLISIHSTLVWAAPSSVQPGLEQFQGWCSHSSSGQPLPVPPTQPVRKWDCSQNTKDLGKCVHLGGRKRAFDILRGLQEERRAKLYKAELAHHASVDFCFSPKRQSENKRLRGTAAGSHRAGTKPSHSM